MRDIEVAKEVSRSMVGVSTTEISILTIMDTQSSSMVGYVLEYGDA